MKENIQFNWSRVLWWRNPAVNDGPWQERINALSMNDTHNYWNCLQAPHFCRQDAIQRLGMGLILQGHTFPTPTQLPAWLGGNSFYQWLLAREAVAERSGPSLLPQDTLERWPQGPVRMGLRGWERQLGGVLLRLVLFKQVFIRAIHSFTFQIHGV